MSDNILQYESKVWATADLLRGAGIKQSDYPKFMMPFFALIMVESRLLRLADEIRDDFGGDLEAFLEEFREYGQGYNEYVLRHGKTLTDLCQNDKTFDIDFETYLTGFDPETRYLLGVNAGPSDLKFLDISGLSGQLKKKRILFATVKAWSEIDLKPFNNSEITTLEEHIKRRWADLSADTAGEQYTPDDIIALIAEILCSKVEKNDRFLTIYDPTCGGGNLLFGVEDRLIETTNRPSKTFGQDWNDALYALAKIESRFRHDSDIAYGNSLTEIKFSDKRFDVVVANPPYGVDWKGFQRDIKHDKTGRFVALPSVSDGQLLFLQHIAFHLNEQGVAVVVHNGSTLFSGDAGSGESTIRKSLFDRDLVEALIQLPTDEFFNTNIYTYLWVLNRHKPDDRKGKVMLINASEKFSLLKKNKGKKRKEIDEQNRLEIVGTLAEFTGNAYAKVFDREAFYYNKQAIMLTNLDDQGRSLEARLPVNTDPKTGEQKPQPSIKLKNVMKILQPDDDGDLCLTNFMITEYDDTQYKSLKAYHNSVLKAQLSRLDDKEKDLKVYTSDAVYWYDSEKDTLIKEQNGNREELGCGRIVVKSSYQKATKTRAEQIVISVELTPDYEKDYEIIPYSADPAENQRNIETFLAKYISKPFRCLENTVGCEINFNKEFYQPEQLRSVQEILDDLHTLEQELHTLEQELAL